MARSTRGKAAFDFIDLGASTGGSLVWASKAFGGTGLGVDMSEEKAQRAREQGHKIMVCDARSIDLPDKAVRYCTMMDFLEHLPSLDDAASVVQSAHRLSRDFLFIALPHFDNEKKLRKMGLKRYYADWSGHSLHLQTTQLLDILSQLDGESFVYRYGEMFDTWDRSIIPVEAPRNSSFYDPNVFAPRVFEALPRKMFYARTFAVLVKSGPLSPTDILMKALTTIGYLQTLAVDVRSEAVGQVA